MKIFCPGCGIETEYCNNKFKPFCSIECKKRDFVNWTGELYKIHSEEAEKNMEETGLDENTLKIIT